MKIRFKASRITTLEPHLIISEIILKLKGNYVIIDRTDRGVIFKKNFWVRRSMLENFRTFSGGEFKIQTLKSETTLHLEYYLNIWHLLIFLLPICFYIYEGDYGIALLYATVLFILIPLQIIGSKDASVVMLNEIADSNILDHPAPTQDQ